MSQPLEQGRAFSKLPLPLAPSVRSVFEFCNGKKFKDMSDEQLSAHITSVRDQAFEIAPWPCLGWFRFVPPGVRRAGVRGSNSADAKTTSTYDRILKHMLAHRDAKILDFGCCFAHDARALVEDGVQPDQIVNADLVFELIELGFTLFADSRDSTHIQGMRFEQADVFKEDDVKRLEVPGGYYAIDVGSFIHLFPLEHQERCVAVLDRLLSDQPGATIFGGQIGRHEGKAGTREREGAKRGPTGVPVDDDSGLRRNVYVHDAKSLPALFERVATRGKGWDARVETNERSLPPGDGVMMVKEEMKDGDASIRLNFEMVRR